MLLELDAGNTRLKWRATEFKTRTDGKETGAELAHGIVIDPTVTGPGSRAEPDQHKRARVCIELLLSQLNNSGFSSFENILVSSVRGSIFEAVCKSMLGQIFGVLPAFAVAAATFNGVRNAYAQADKLGVDRWLAMLAAYADARGACCVLDCGTTITLDLVTAEGVHLGGYIVPGLQLMHECLGQRSSALQVDPVQPQLGPGISTQAAIANGAMNMALGFVNFQHRKAGKLLAEYSSAEPCWYLTGGDAPNLAAGLEWEFKLVPDLVLEGLRLTWNR